MLLAPASVTGPLIDLATRVVRSLGLGGVAVLMASSGVIGVPGTEPTMLFAGFNVFQGHLSLLGVIVAGVVGDMASASVAYAIGFYGSRELLERHGSKLHLDPNRVDTAHRWFKRHGDPAIVVSRVLPLVRAAFPYAAGIAEMSFWRFFALGTLGSIIWVSGLGVLGREVGRSWESWRKHLEYADYAAVAIVVLGLAYLLLRRYRSRQRRKPAIDVVSK